MEMCNHMIMSCRAVFNTKFFGTLKRGERMSFDDYTVCYILMANSQRT